MTVAIFDAQIVSYLMCRFSLYFSCPGLKLLGRLVGKRYLESEIHIPGLITVSGMLGWLLDLQCILKIVSLRWEWLHTI